jgi:serine/threonine protein phosphatase 1
MATIAIGDVHGNLRALTDLLERIAPEVDDSDTVVFLGDYVDRGSDSCGCIDRVLELRATLRAQVVTLLGNHEDWLLRTYHDYSCHSWVLGMRGLDTIRSYSVEASQELHNEIIRSGWIEIVEERLPLSYEVFFDAMPAEHIEFLTGLKNFHRTPDAVCVHGGLDPDGVKIEDQTTEDLVWGTHKFPERYVGDDTIIYGHKDDPVLDEEGWPHPRVFGRTYGLDTISSGVLTAVRLPDGTIFQSDRYTLDSL